MQTLSNHLEFFVSILGTILKLRGPILSNHRAICFLCVGGGCFIAFGLFSCNLSWSMCYKQSISLVYLNAMRNFKGDFGLVLCIFCKDVPIETPQWQGCCIYPNISGYMHLALCEKAHVDSNGPSKPSVWIHCSSPNPIDRTTGSRVKFIYLKPSPGPIISEAHLQPHQIPLAW